MSAELPSLEWPEDLEEGETLDGGAAERVEVDAIRARPQSDDDYHDDLQYITKMTALLKLTKHVMCALNLSDGNTDHCVNFDHVFATGREYIVVYSEVWPLEWGTFLQDGKNIVGSKAKLVDEDRRLWSVTYEELFSVLISFTWLTPEKEIGTWKLK